MKTPSGGSKGFFTADGLLKDDLLLYHLRVAIGVSNPLSNRLSSLKVLAEVCGLLGVDDILLITDSSDVIGSIIGITQEIEGRDDSLIFWSIKILQFLILDDNIEKWFQHRGYLITLLQEEILSPKPERRQSAAALLEVLSPHLEGINLTDLTQKMRESIRASRDTILVHRLVRSIKNFMLRMKGIERQNYCGVLLLPLVTILEPNTPLYCESLVHHVLCILFRLLEDEVIVGLLLQTNALHNLVMVINKGWGLQTCNISASCILLIYSYPQYVPLLQNHILISIFYAFVRSNSFQAQSIALEAILQAIKTFSYDLYDNQEYIEIYKSVSEFLRSPFRDLQLHALGIFLELSARAFPMTLKVSKIFEDNLDLLVTLLSGSREHKALSLSVINNLSRVPSLQEIIAKSGALDTLIQSISSEDSVVRSSAMETLHNLSETDENKRNILCRSSVTLGRLLDLTKDESENNENPVGLQATRTLISLSRYGPNKLHLTHAGVIEPLFALALNDLDLGEAKHVLEDFCDDKQIQVQTGMLVALLSLSKMIDFAYRLIEMNFHQRLIELFMVCNDDKLMGFICCILSRFSAISDVVKKSFMSQRVVAHLLLLIRETQNASLWSDVFSIIGCALLSPDESDVKIYQEALLGDDFLLLWRGLITNKYSPLRYRVVNILRLLAHHSESRAQKILSVIPISTLLSMEEQEKDQKIAKDLMYLVVVLEHHAKEK